MSRTVSTSLTLDVTVLCTPETDILQPGAAAQGVLPPGTATNSVTGFDTSTPAVATAAPVVRHPDPKAKEVPTLRLSESPDLLPSFGLSSPSPSPTLAWGTAEDPSPPFSPNRVREGHSQDVPDGGSLFNVSPLSPGLVVRPTREDGAAPSEGVLLPTRLEDFDDSVLGDPISYARFEQFLGSESPSSLPACATVRAVLSAGPSGAPDWVGFQDLYDTARGIFDLCNASDPGGGRVRTVWTAELFMQILGVRRSAVYMWKPGLISAAQVFRRASCPPGEMETI